MYIYCSGNRPVFIYYYYWGFGFVEMEDSKEAGNAMEALNDSDIDGRKIVVNEAKPRD
jgi:RNA recognition motif-containing protein